MPSDGPPGVVWLHGYTMDSTLWRPLWQLLPGTRHLGMDLPGHGTATLEPLPSSLPALAGVVARRMERDRCRTLVGLSFGSCVALQVALDHPQVVDRLVLAAPTLAGNVDDPQARDKYIALSHQYRRSGSGPELTALWMAGPPAIFSGLRRRPEAFARVETVVRAHTFAELRTGGMRALTTSVHSTGQLASLALPVLVVVGSEDMERFRDNAALLGAAVPGCRIAVVKGAGHLPLLEDPDTCADVLAPFLSGAVQPDVGGAAHP